MAYAEFGGSRSGFFTAGLVSAQLLAFNAQRKKLVIINDSANNVYLSKGTSVAVVGSGVTLLPGGAWNMEPDTRGRIWKGAIQCISGVAGQNLSWIEDW